MKKLFIFIAFCAVLTACKKGQVVSNDSFIDTIHVDTTLVDTTQVDSVVE